MTAVKRAFLTVLMYMGVKAGPKTRYDLGNAPLWMWVVGVTVGLIILRAETYWH